MKNKKHVYLVEIETWDSFNMVSGGRAMAFFKEEEAFNFVKTQEREFTERIFNGDIEEGEENIYEIKKVYEDQTCEDLYYNTIYERQCFEQFMEMI